eukprot:12894359-Prorocentrum_lima.AAC.1
MDIFVRGSEVAPKRSCFGSHAKGQLRQEPTPMIQIVGIVVKPVLLEVSACDCQQGGCIYVSLPSLFRFVVDELK